MARNENKRKMKKSGGKVLFGIAHKSHIGKRQNKIPDHMEDFFHKQVKRLENKLKKDR